MLSYIVSLIASSIEAAIQTVSTLIYPALFFIALSLILKRREAIQSFWKATTEIRINIKIACFNLIFITPVIVILATAMTQLVQGYGLILLPAETWVNVPTAITIIVAVFVGDFAGYWRHRLEHTRILWPSHAVHHSDTEMNWFSLERFHPINRVTTYLLDNAALLLLGLPPYAVVANSLIRHYYGYFIHADLPWTYGRFFGSIFVSPAMHRWHHAADIQAFNTNYATVFSMIDRWFGTQRVPGPCDAPLGVTDKIEQSFRGQLRYPFQKSAYQRSPTQPKSSK